MPEPLTLGGHTWDLRYSARALRALQMTYGDLTAFVGQLTAQAMGTGMRIESQAVLVWAGQLHAEPRLTPKRVEVLLRMMDPRARYLLVTWAAAECMKAILEMAGAQIDAVLPKEPGDGEAE